MLRLLNYVNNKWNSAIFWIHDITARCGVGHMSVWLYDTLVWRLPAKWQLFCGKTNEQYMLEHELYIARHQAQYYANLAYEYQWILIEAASDIEDCQAISEIVYEENKQNKEKVKSK